MSSSVARPTVRELEMLANRIRRTVLEMCAPRGGYAGQGVALAEIGAALFFHEMRLGSESTWPGYDYHDRFVLSNGHDAIIVYAALLHKGVYTHEELLTYGAEGSRIEMSPLEQAAPGFEMTAGSLGEGPSQSAGIAYGERLRGSDRRVYCLLSDGELQEGNVWEGAMFAAHHKLDNLVLIVDNNDMQASGHTKDILGVEPVVEKFEAFGFAARRIDGNDMAAVLSAFDDARVTKGKPFVIVADTRMFTGTPSLLQKYAMEHFLRADAAEFEAAIQDLDSEYAEWAGK